jgi:hypothetical protein
MNKKYKSKNGFLFPTVIILVLTLIFKVTYLSDGKLLGPIIIICMIAFIAPMFLRTYYIITDDNKLKIVSGYFYNKTIELVDIVRISDAKGDGANGPALSMDRIEIKYGIDKTVLLSPENKDDFIEEMLKINPNIEIKGF